MCLHTLLLREVSDSVTDHGYCYDVPPGSPGELFPQSALEVQISSTETRAWNLVGSQIGGGREMDDDRTQDSFSNLVRRMILCTYTGVETWKGQIITRE